MLCSRFNSNSVSYNLLWDILAKFHFEYTGLSFKLHSLESIKYLTNIIIPPYIKYRNDDAITGAPISAFIETKPYGLILDGKAR